MARRTVSRGTQRRAPQRKMVWARKRAVTTLGVLPLKFNLLEDFETAYGANLIGATIIRIRGAAVLDADAGVNMVLAARIGQASEAEPAPAGTGPLQDPFADWFMWEPFLSVAGEAPGTPAHGRVIDVKSARKMEEIGEEAILYMQSSAAGVLAWDLSVLLKLP